MFRESKLPIKKILISGAGIAGLTLARQLKKLGVPFMIIEKKSHLSTDGAGIALPANAIQALRYLGISKPIEEFSHRVNKIIYTDTSGTVLNGASLLETPLNADHFVALHRSKFHEILCDGIQKDIQFGTEIVEIKRSLSGLVVKFNNPRLKQEEFSLVVGADGINSKVRKLTLPETELIDLGVTIWRWTCNYPTEDLQPTYMLGAKDIFMAYPIGKNEVYCYAHAFDPENVYSKSSNHKETLHKVFSSYGGITKTLLELLPDNRLIIPGRLRSIPKPLFGSGRVVLIGDAGHACSPMLQQGAASALEDVIVLSELLKNFPIEAAVVHYEKCRLERVKWVMDSSDGPMKMLINIDLAVLSVIQQAIREKGPLNVQGWKKLLTINPIMEILDYIEKVKEKVKVPQEIMSPAPLLSKL